ncbi:MAG: hypothetical protein FJ125_13660, partial [Deltaproteobacteria bacterium]|nr:hypothetical protein [Deltaproteobacteria bacterium]
QAPDPQEALAPGASLERVVRYTNTGRLRWRKEGDEPLLLGTIEPRDRSSPFFDEASWISPSRPARMESEEVAPGEDASFRVLFRVPAGGGEYRESFAPLVEGAEPVWLDEQPATWTLRVEGPEDGDGDGYAEDEDCDDTDPRVHPGAAEICNGKDDDCAGGPDDGIPPGRPARLVWTAVSTGVLRINGQEADRSDRWQEVRVVPVQLGRGANVVSIEAERGSGRGGVLAVVWLPDGEQLPSNSRWEAAAAAAEGWDVPGGASEGFSAATVSAFFGQDPWSAALVGLPPEVERAGLTWIWSREPELDDSAFLRRVVHEPEDCVVEGGSGACSRGIWECRDGQARCVARQGPEGLKETCNGIDDDCDGLTDEFLPGCATADDAGLPPPDLGPSPPTGTLLIPPPRQTGDEDSIAGNAGCSCRAGGGEGSGGRAGGVGAGVGGLLLALALARRLARRVDRRVRQAGGGEAPGAQLAGLAAAAGTALLVGIVAGVGQRQVHAEPDGFPGDLRLAPEEQRSTDAQRLPLHARPGGHPGQHLEGVEELRPAVGVARIVHGIDADEDVARPGHLGQLQGQTEQDRVARRHITNWNFG